MDQFCDTVTTLLKKPEEYLRENGDLRASWVAQTKRVYDFLKGEEGRYGLPECQDALPKLYTDGLDNEQVWQLIELQNKSLLSAESDNLEELSDTNLCYAVARLSSLAKFDKLDGDDDSDDFDGGGDSEDDDSEDDEEELEGEEDGEGEEEMMGEEEEYEEEEEEYENDEDDLFAEPEGLKESGLDTNFDNDTDDEEDNFDEFIAKHDTDDETDEDEEKEIEKQKSETKNKKKKKEKNKEFQTSSVDSKFFNLRESEWVADNDMLGDNYEDEGEDDIDMMAAASDDEEVDAMYGDFFDEAPAEGKPKKLSDMLPDEDEEDEEEEEEDDKEEEEDGDEEEGEEEEEEAEEMDTEEATQLLGNKVKESKSTFEREQEAQQRVIASIEDDLVAEKPWHLKGEVTTAQRPENSALEEHLEYNLGTRHKPVITEDVTTLIEQVIMKRIRSKAWDDVERKVRPNTDPFEYKKKLLLDQEKSKMSLAEIYEKEYLKQSEGTGEAEEEEPEEHKEIKARMDKLFGMLDALSNYHYTPLRTNAEVKVQSNLPALTMEDATPITMSDAATLAPQEVLAPVKGDLKAKTERTSTDQKREHRMKKSLQKKKAKRQDQWLREKMAKAGRTGQQLDAKATMKFVEKAVKAGHVKVLEGGQNKAVKSSEQFFKELQQNQKTKQNKADPAKPAQTKKKTKNKKKHGLTASKVMM